MKDALIIFVRKPQKGKVKTRLAATIGEEAALHIYKKLLAHTFDITSNLNVDKFVFYAGEIVENDIWSHKGFYKSLQQETDLGGRMKAAFDYVFSKGYERVIIIGSDCPYLTSDMVACAFEALNEKDVVIGPAEDGGYYLLGLKAVFEPLFQNKAWSTSTVYNDTVKSMQQLQLSYKALQVLSDVDEKKDVPAHWLNY